MKEEKVISLLKHAKFTFAKTMPKTPHSYTLRKNWESDDDFCDVVSYIRDHGVREKFGRRYYIYFYHNGYKYWTMGYPIHITKLINRAKDEK